MAILRYARNHNIDPETVEGVFLTENLEATEDYERLLEEAKMADAAFAHGADFFGAITFVLQNSMREWLAVLVRHGILVSHEPPAGAPFSLDAHWEWCDRTLQLWEADPGAMRTWVLVHVQGLGPSIDAMEQQRRVSDRVQASLIDCVLMAVLPRPPPTHPLFPPCLLVT